MKRKKLQKEFDKFMNEQLNILKGHFGRCMLRCVNKLHELEDEDIRMNNEIKARRSGLCLISQ